MRMERIFANVGSALFCLENIFDTTIIYDCGGANVGLISSRINELVPDKSYYSSKDCDVDILFLSHFHNDHINGVRHLLTTKRVKTVVLPMLEEYERFYVAAYNFLGTESHSSYNDDIASLTLDPVGTIQQWSPSTKVIQVRAANEPGQLEFPRNENEPIEIDRLGSQISSGTPIIPNGYPFPPHPFWEYICWNIDTITPSYRRWMKKKYDAFVKKCFGNQPTLVEVWNLFLKMPHVNQQYVKNKMFGVPFYTVNDRCMAVYSGCMDPHLNPVGCLYLGDFNAKRNFKFLQQAYWNKWDNIEVVQIPHHGSDKNYSSQLIDGNKPTVAVVSDSFPISKSNRINTLHKLVDDNAWILITGQFQTAIEIDFDVWTNYQYIRLF